MLNFSYKIKTKILENATLSIERLSKQLLITNICALKLFKTLLISISRDFFKLDLELKAILIKAKQQQLVS